MEFHWYATPKIMQIDTISSDLDLCDGCIAKNILSLCIQLPKCADGSLENYQSKVYSSITISVNGNERIVEDVSDYWDSMYMNLDMSYTFVSPMLEEFLIHRIDSDLYKVCVKDTIEYFSNVVDTFLYLVYMVG